MAYVCEVLDTTTNVCLQWAEYVQPKISMDQLNSLTYYIILLFIVVWAYKQVGSLIKNFK